MTLFTIITAGCSLLLITNGVCYVFLTPEAKLGRSQRFQYAIRWVMRLCTILSLLRLPFAILPYLSKVLLFLILRNNFFRWWRTSYIVQLIRTLGDLLSFMLTVSLLWTLLSTTFWWGVLFWLSFTAEGIRLATEKGQMLISASWQMLPHRTIALHMPVSLQQFSPIRRYVGYYQLTDPARIDFIVQYLRIFSSQNAETADRLAYLTTFRIMSNEHGLGAGHVRDVALGEVFIHRRWTNDPFLMIGQALRRTPWLFDPRFLPRPFHYRTDYNRLATWFVLNHVHYSLPYALYQIGHEIKVARYSVFHWLIILIGGESSSFLRGDGTYEFDPLLAGMARRFGWDSSTLIPPMKSDAEIVKELARLEALPSAMEIAEQYCYPICYIEDVLLKKVSESQENADLIASAVAAGASQ